MNRKEEAPALPCRGTKRMKIIKKSIAFILMVFCLFVSSVSVIAEVETPRVIFKNEENTTPDLYISKHVECADERYEIPDEVFRFILKLDDKLANAVTYRVFDQEGTEVFQKDADGNNIPFQTDRSGMFTLTAEQTAMFEYVGTGKSYQVTELLTEHFEQTQPAGGVPAQGTVQAEGSAVHFTNMYFPEDPEEAVTKLEVRKSIAFPDGYELPETPEFTYLLTIKNKPYVNEPYTIIDTVSGSVISSDAVTDEDGRFAIKGGQTAVFEEIPVGVDYHIEEEQTQGWHVVDKTIREGATKAPVTLETYTNASASFGVSKRLAEPTDSEAVFGFLLVDGERNAMADVSYYLYKSNGDRVDETEHKTDERGSFQLQAEQTAIFFGIEPGTIYQVKEEAHQDFWQQLPADSVNGYTGKEAGDSVEILPFVNKAYDKETSVLSVTKLIENQTEETPSKDTEFTFRLLKKTDDETYEPVVGAGYSITTGGSTKTFSTNGNGEFTLKASETARFEQLKDDETYQVKEINLPLNYYIEKTDQTKEGVLNENIYFTFTNQYRMEKADLHILKKNDKEISLSGAIFELYEDAELTQKVGEGEYTTNEEGKLAITDLKLGTYYLVEKQAPTGYQLLINPIVIELYIKNDQIAVKADGKDHTTADETEPI